MTVKTDRLVTLFGGGGFVGRYVAQALFKAGARVRIAEREPRSAFFLKPLTGLGMIQFVRADIRDSGDVAAAVQGADSVINLVGILSGNFQAIHVDGARNIAEAAAKAGAKSLVHVSAIGADPGSESAYGRSKGEGEQAVRSAFPDATIVRPSVVFGMEDNFVNRFARMARILPFIPVLRGKWKVQPVHCADLGKAIADAALQPELHRGRTYELGGPQVISMSELNHWICQATGRSTTLVEIPDGVGAAIARLTGWLPGSPISWDQWLMLQHDNVVSGGGNGFEVFGIRPAPLAAVAEGWLSSYRRRGRWAPVQSSY
ncbi:MAG TPA: complex I NDUFA9 subunit family protein [Allosphingosinicella sp.]|nr:complex I NDUFA9 subunit family protein [Allosphingosinicella sp.]